jgi:hypothetical protein
MWFDGQSEMHFENLNMGQDFTFSLWFHATNFGTLYSITESGKGTTMEIRQGFSGTDNQPVVELYLKSE